MSMNQYMHPRNIYKQPPDFKQLAIEYPEFRKHVIQDITGKVTIDFKNVEALKSLTCTLLKKDFDINLDIPSDKLIPTVPLRLNYILWIEDLLDLTGSNDIKGIDIGTGASCIYPLIAAKKNKWCMLATEIDIESIKYARKNVSNNNLENLITIIEGDQETFLKQITGDYDFCMCNPPFFASTQELHPFFKSRANRPHPKNAFCASVPEVVSKGGEIEYITKLINESKELKNRIKIYTTMIGHKSSLPPLKKLLREIGVVSFKQTEFCQGHTTRWGLAWTFLDIDLRKIPDSLVAAKQKLPKPLVWGVPHKNDTDRKVDLVAEKLVKLFKDLEFDCREVKHVKNFMEFIMVALTNTWSHQRRKRREKSRLNQSDGSSPLKNSSGSSQEGMDIHQTCDKLSEMDVNGGGVKKKRSLDDDSGFYDNKKKFKSEDSSENIYLKFKLSIGQVGNEIGLELLFIEGRGGKEALHQILQYLKNNFE